MPKVRWAYKTYTDVINSNMLPEVQAHIASMKPAKQENYIKYLIEWCAFPKDFAR